MKVKRQQGQTNEYSQIFQNKQTKKIFKMRNVMVYVSLDNGPS